METLIDNRFQVLEKIGEGSFGIIFRGYDTKEKMHCALKMELSSRVHQQLFNEYVVYKQFANNPTFPSVFGYYPSYTWSNETYNILCMELLGDNLETLFQKCNRKFSVQTVCKIAVQALERIRDLHEKFYLHRDIKPENLLFKENILFLIDYGFVKKYRSKVTGQHVEYGEGRGLTGTARYASINTHLGVKGSRRDDLESLAYTLLYFLRGSLPWMGVRAVSKRQKYQKIMEKKLASPIHFVCKGYPNEFETFLTYVRMLRYADTPDYEYLIQLFKKYTVDTSWDWNTYLEPVTEDPAEEEN